MPIKTALFHAAKLAGAFARPAGATQGRLTILCYHGFSLGDEHRFRPGLFMRPELFAERLDWLKANDFRVLPLGEAVDRLRQGRTGAKEVVITIDDGFHGVAAKALPLLASREFPATVYVTTYYVTRNHPIFRLALQYFFWRARGRAVDVSGLVPGVEGDVRAGTPDGERALWRIIDHAETRGDEPRRQALAAMLADRTGCSYEELARTRQLTLMTEAEIREAVAGGFDIQLHTHRHRMPEDAADVRREIEDNRHVLEPLVGSRLRHLCYPSGVWSKARWPALEAAGIQTATTCDPGMNVARTPALGLLRFLDRDDMPRIVFEGELCGFGETWRRVRRILP